jgi:hypothetical protein
MKIESCHISGILLAANDSISHGLLAKKTKALYDGRLLSLNFEVVRVRSFIWLFSVGAPPEQ